MASAKKSSKKAARKRAKTAKRGKLTPRAQRGTTADQTLLDLSSPPLAELSELVRAQGGVPIAGYAEPFSGQPLLFASLPIASIQPTPFQRDLSPTHARRLSERIEETGVFLDPLIAVAGPDECFWTPNGRHRLAAAKSLGLRQITALLSPDPALTYRILALNTEKAHNLKDKSLEVIRMAKSLARSSRQSKESDYAAEFEAAELLTLGLVYERNARFGGGAYSPMLKKVDRFSSRTLPVALRDREGYAARLCEIEQEVKRIVSVLHGRGMRSPYLRNYVVARINPVRFHKAKRGDETPAMPIGSALIRMLGAARKFNLDSVNMRDLAFVAAGAEQRE
ncbi:MAG: ParB N-terminal domain-containing protein [Steroidobacteraceae bacterium]